jgi:hypothetical protein
MSEDSVFVFVATYSGVGGAEGDYEAVKELHSSGVVGTYDATVVNEDDEGRRWAPRARLPRHRK